MNDIAERLAKIRQRTEAATEGPWRRSIWNHATGDESPCVTTEGLTLFRTHEAPAWTFEKRDYDADAEFVAAARSDVPYLLSLVERLVAGMPEGADTRHQDPELVRALRDAEVEG